MPSEDFTFKSAKISAKWRGLNFGEYAHGAIQEAK
jgi:hypothetical protein